MRFGTMASSVFGFNVHGNIQPVLKPRLFDLQIIIQQLEFLPQRDFLNAAVFERHAEKFGKFQDHIPRGGGVAVDEDGNRVQGY